MARANAESPTHAADSAEAAASMLKNPIEMLAKEIHYGPLPDEVRAVIIASWRRGGLLPAAMVEQMVSMQNVAT